MSDTTSMDMSLNESSDGVDMTRPATVLSREHVYQGAIFGVEDMRIALQTRDGGQTVIRRQVMRHAPCVVMLVHDCAQDLYLVEREYRVGCDAFAYGLPAGLIDDGEDVDAAALRELANIMVMHLRHWQAVERHFDADEHVESAWIPWKQLRDTHITASNSEIAILHEQIRRMRQQ